MSIAHSKGHPEGKGKEGWELISSKKSEKAPRGLSQPSSAPDLASYRIHVSGNTKPQEPPYLELRRSKSTEAPRLAGNNHKQPWTFCAAPGRKENPHHTNPYHRVWITDAGRQGRVYDKVDESEDLSAPRRWNRHRKKEHYTNYHAELDALKPHDEVFAIKSNVKFWTHLQNKGVRSGGQEKLDYAPMRGTGMHLKHSIYSGKFQNVRHAQLICKTGRKNAKNEPEEWQVDNRPMFDNRLHDDMVRYNDERDKELSTMSYSLLCPVNTRSCPQMGAEWMNR